MKKQQGMSFIGLVITVAFIVFIAVIVTKMLPAYTEFWSVKNAIAKIAKEPNFSEMGKRAIQEEFDRSSAINDVHTISGVDLLITKEEGLSVVSADYQVLVPLMGNVSALIKFKTASND